MAPMKKRTPMVDRLAEEASPIPERNERMMSRQMFFRHFFSSETLPYCLPEEDGGDGDG